MGRVSQFLLTDRICSLLFFLVWRAARPFFRLECYCPLPTECTSLLFHFQGFGGVCFYATKNRQLDHRHLYFERLVGSSSLVLWALINHLHFSFVGEGGFSLP